MSTNVTFSTIAISIVGTPKEATRAGVTKDTLCSRTTRDAKVSGKILFYVFFVFFPSDLL